MTEKTIGVRIEHMTDFQLLQLLVKDQKFSPETSKDPIVLEMIKREMGSQGFRPLAYLHGCL